MQVFILCVQLQQEVQQACAVDIKPWRKNLKIFLHCTYSYELTRWKLRQQRWQNPLICILFHMQIRNFGLFLCNLCSEYEYAYGRDFKTFYTKSILQLTFFKDFLCGPFIVEALSCSLECFAYVSTWLECTFHRVAMKLWREIITLV